jgi:hypothetical protein
MFNVETEMKNDNVMENTVLEHLFVSLHVNMCRIISCIDMWKKVGERER